MVTYEIQHHQIIHVLADRLGVPAEAIELVPITSEDANAVQATVRVDLATANKVNGRLRRIRLRRITAKGG